MIPRRSTRSSHSVTCGLAVVSVVLLSACGSTQQISRQQMMAPENMEIAMRGSVAVIEFTGEGGQDVADRLAAGLERVWVHGRPVFDVNGPVRLHSGRSGVIGNVDPAEARDYARSVGAHAVLIGQTSYDSDVQLLPPQTEESCEVFDAAGGCLEVWVEIRQCAEISVTMDFSVQGMDTETGEVIYNPRPGRAARATTQCISTGDDPAVLITRLLNNDFGRSIESMEAQLAQTAADRVHSDIAPYPETFRLSFLTEGDRLTDAQEAQFEQAADLIEDGHASAACSVWEGMARSGTSDRAVAYNLATCAEEAGNFQAAMEAYESVYRMVFHTPMRSTGNAPQGEGNYELSEWADLLSAARARVRRRFEAEETLVLLSAPPSM